jgi:hypothetical protein
MNNLTPLQELASRIYAGIAPFSLQNGIDFETIRNTALDEAKALLEAIKPEPLEWLQKKNDNKSYSKDGQFEINWLGVHNSLYSGIKFEDFHGNFNTSDEAKQFAEHIRTR